MKTSGTLVYGGHQQAEQVDRQDEDPAEEGGQAVERLVGVLDGELDGVVGLVAGHAVCVLLPGWWT